MKKIIALVLVLIMMLSFASCAKPTAKFVISDGINDSVLYEFEAEVDGKTTAAAMLEEYLTENKIPYTVYDGDVIASIGDLEHDEETWSVYWAFYHNGDYATVGLWSYIPAECDVIELRYEELSGNM